MNTIGRHSAVSLGVGAPVLGFDVGGTDTKATLVGADGCLLEVIRVPTRRGDDIAGSVLDQVTELASELMARHPEHTPEAVGLLVPGHIDEPAGVGIFAENFGWHDVPFRDLAQDRLNLPVAFSHDVRGAGEAEFRLGAAKPFRDVIVLVIGTGIAGAVFTDGHPYLGGGLAGELGHSKVADSPVCACGGAGCLEAIASAGAITRLYNLAAGTELPGAEQVLHLVADGDPVATAVWNEALDALALALSHTVALLAPEAIVIGGGLSEAGDALFVPLRERLAGILTFHRRPQLLPASIGPDAGVIGAALKARDLRVDDELPDTDERPSADEQPEVAK